MRISYVSGWQTAFLHCRKDNDAVWTNAPGIELKKNASGTFELDIEAAKLEFVCTNGSGGWDKPAQGGNYRVDGQGTYELRNGRINILSTGTQATVTRSCSRSELPEERPTVEPLSKASIFRKTSLSVLGPVKPDDAEEFTRRKSFSILGGGVIQLKYVTDWEQPYMHCMKNKGAWTELPGVAWKKGGGNKLWTLEIDNAIEMEFVCHDNKGAWDKPKGGGNYCIDGPGEYTVRDGQLRRSCPPPKPPKLAVVNGVGPTSVELAWNPPEVETGIACYRIYQESEGGGYNQKEPEPIGEARDRRYLVQGLKGSLTFNFKITTVNEDGAESDGITVQATTSSAGKPSPPTFLQVTSVSTDQITLSWAPPQDIGGASVTAYHVFRNGSAVDTIIARDPDTGVDKTNLSWTDKNVQKGEKYNYTISAMHMPDRRPSQSELIDLLEKRASKSLLEVPEEDNEGPSCEEVTASAVVPVRMPKLGEQVPHVMLQGFNWWSCDNKKGWYNVLKGQVQNIKAAGFDMVWLPPPAFCVDKRGYLPSKWYDLNSKYGTQDELIALGQELTDNQICPVLDLVVNHRCASQKDDRGRYTVFEQPDWGAWAICGNDQSGAGEGAQSTGELLEYAPDIDHTNPKVQQDVKDWVAWMFKTVGIRALRLDFVIGFAPYLQEQYARAAGSPFTVAEYWHGDPDVLKNYINATKGQIAVFDFPVYYTLKNCVRTNEFGGLNWGGKPAGIMGSDPVRSCTFVENHDTDHLEVVGGPFGDNNQIVQGYVYILTHPGTPSVFWSDWSDRGQDVQGKINKAVQIRIAMGVHCLSKCSMVASEGGLYAAYIDGHKGTIAMKLGGRDWKPNGGNWTTASAGHGFCIWTKPR